LNLVQQWCTELPGNKIELSYDEFQGGNQFVHNDLFPYGSPWKVRTDYFALCKSNLRNTIRIQITDANLLQNQNLFISALFYGTPNDADTHGHTLSFGIQIEGSYGTFRSYFPATHLDTNRLIPTSFPTPPLIGPPFPFAYELVNQLKIFTVIPNAYLVNGAEIKFYANSTKKLDYLTRSNTGGPGSGLDILLVSRT
jgi:hypothetical protein